ncbi:FKBP12-associated protein [Tulasnella sp. 424]|nr:FKBP12-associated protein [Tulasnella sp. 424]
MSAPDPQPPGRPPGESSTSEPSQNPFSSGEPRRRGGRFYGRGKPRNIQERDSQRGQQPVAAPFNEGGSQDLAGPNEARSGSTHQSGRGNRGRGGRGGRGRPPRGDDSRAGPSTEIPVQEDSEQPTEGSSRGNRGGRQPKPPKQRRQQQESSQPNTGNPTPNGSPTASNSALPAVPLPNAPGQHTSRRQRFGAKLTTSETPPAPKVKPSATPITHDMDLTSRLTASFSRSASAEDAPDCPICFNSISPGAPTWSCTPAEWKSQAYSADPVHIESGGANCCWTTFHLKCIKAWASKSVTETRDAGDVLGAKPNGQSCQSIIAAFAAEWSIHDLAGSLHPTVAEKAAPDLESAANILVHCRTKKCYEITAGRERAVRGEEDDDDPRDDITGAFLCKRKCEASKNCGKHICGRVCCPLAALAGVGESSGKGKRRQRNAPTAEELAELDPEGWHNVITEVRAQLVSKLRLRSSFAIADVPFWIHLSLAGQEFTALFHVHVLLHPAVTRRLHMHVTKKKSVLPAHICLKRSAPVFSATLGFNSSFQALGLRFPLLRQDLPCRALWVLQSSVRQAAETLFASSSSLYEAMSCTFSLLRGRALPRNDHSPMCLWTPKAASGLRKVDFQLRNERLAAALGITRGEDGKASTLGQSETKYSEKLQQFWKANSAFAGTVEKSLNDFVSSEKKLIVLRPMPPPKRKFVRDLAEMYRLDATDIDPEPRRSVELRRRLDTRIPKPLLSEVINPPKTSTAGPSTSAWGKSPAPPTGAPVRSAWGQRAPGTSGTAAPWSAVVHNAVSGTAGSTSSRPRTPVLPEPQAPPTVVRVAQPAPATQVPPSGDVPSSWDDD